MLPILPMAFLAPFVGLLAWTWISFMNPHLEAVGFLSSFPLLDILAAVTILAWIMAPDKKEFPKDPVIALLLIFIFWCCITTIFSQNIEMSFEKLVKIFKINLLVLMSVIIAPNRHRLFALLAVIAISIGYWSIWGGVGAIANLGRYIHTGPPGTMIGDRNDLSLAMAMTAPIMLFLATQMPYRWLRWAGYLAATLTILSILGTQSRGGLICVVGMGGYLILRSRHRLKLALVSLVAGGLVFSVADQAWLDRMSTIENASADASALGRFQMWRYGMVIAQEFPATGGGFRLYHNGPLAANYLPEGVQLRASHSIYFEVLGEHGYIGLALFLSMIAGAFLVCWRVGALAKTRSDLDWARRLAFALELSLIAYLLAGAFLEQSTFDLFYTLLGLVAILHAIVKKECAEQARSTPLMIDDLFEVFRKKTPAAVRA
jgi:probable O-glycosylation ligase (exosortase A-associated)